MDFNIPKFECWMLINICYDFLNILFELLKTNISFSSYEQPIRISKFYNKFFVYLLFQFFYKVRCF